MDHVKAIGTKFAMITVVLFLVLGFTGVPFGDFLMTGILLTVIAYLIGDLWLLPSFGNWTATLADFGLSFAGIWIIGTFLFPAINLPFAAFIASVLIAVGEWFFHKYMMNTLHNNNRRNYNHLPQRA
ncbi:DUF2512 family protein [Salsuginibacillus kocurii]|uniref:DUF2512 family protein n=1 Tax=Salsuginibacillus kocurii TaxID=427078 RepID=UPI0003758CAA|nr:DUF2512 family protein [Salsuginibacillus kocurii]